MLEKVQKHNRFLRKKKIGSNCAQERQYFVYSVSRNDDKELRYVGLGGYKRAPS